MASSLGFFKGLGFRDSGPCLGMPILQMQFPNMRGVFWRGSHVKDCKRLV